MVSLGNILGAMRAAVRLLRQILQSHQTVVRFFGQTQHVSVGDSPLRQNSRNPDNSSPR